MASAPARSLWQHLDVCRYSSVEDFITDVKLVWYNAYLYNQQGSPVHEAAKELEDIFDKKLQALVASSAGTSTPSSSGNVVGGDVPHTLIRPIIKSLQSHVHSKPFRVPVDYVALQLPHYPQVITKPMDLLTVSTNLEQGKYATVAEVRRLACCGPHAAARIGARRASSAIQFCSSLHSSLRYSGLGQAPAAIRPLH